MNNTSYSLVSFEDIHYRALNKLNNMRTDSTFTGELSIKIDFKKFLKYCVEENLIKYATPEESLHLMTTSELKRILDKCQYPKNGKKDELITHILSIPSLNIGTPYYKHTLKAKEILEKHWSHREPKKLTTIAELQQISLDELESYRKCGIKKFIFVATLDKTTCPICGALDGKIVPISKAVIGVNCPPMHDRCRCTTVACNRDILDSTRFMRNPVSGRSETIPYTTYIEWKKQYLD